MQYRDREPASPVLLKPNFPTAQTNSLVPRLLVSGETLCLKLSTQLELFPRSHDNSSCWKSTGDLFRHIRSLPLSSSLFLTGKIMFTSLIDYFSKQTLSALNNDFWNFHRPKQQYQLISLISQIFTLKEWFLSTDFVKWFRAVYPFMIIPVVSMLKRWWGWKLSTIIWWRV